MSVKISALPAVPSALLTDFFPMVQGGVTYKETLSQVVTLFNANLAFLPLSGGTLSGALDMGGFKINNMADPTLAQDAATKAYVDSVVVGGPFLPLAGGTMAGIINMNSHKITNVTDPTVAQDAATKSYVDSSIHKGVTDRIVYVDAGGSDVTGDGSILFPVATIFKANSLVSGNTTTNRWIISMGAGRFIETQPIVVKPFVSYVGRGNSATYITSSNNLITLDASFGAGTARVYLSSMYIGGTTAINFDLNALGGAFSCVAEMIDIGMNAGVTFLGRALGADFLEWYGGYALGNIQISDAQGFLNGLLLSSDVTLDTANNAGHTIFNLLGCGVNGNVLVTSTGGTANNSGINASSIGGTLTVSGATTTLSIDAVSLPTLISNYTVSGGAAVTFTTSDWGINQNYVPVNYTPTATTVDGNFHGIDNALATLSPTRIGNQYYIDPQNGNDANSGSMFNPWKTLQHAYAAVTPNNNFFTVFNIVPGVDTADVAPISGKPNVFLNGLGGPATIAQDITIVGAAANSTIYLTNVILNGAFNWVQNDGFTMNLNLDYSFMNGLTTFQQQGAAVGGSFLYAQNSFLLGLNVTAGQTTLNATNCDGTFTYNDSGAAFFQAEGGNMFNAAWTFNGGIEAEFAGVYSDTGYTITTATTGSGTPIIGTDCSSIPPTITGPHTFSFISQAQYINSNYVPVNYTATSTDVTGNLQGIDNALGSMSGGFTWNDQTVTPVTIVTKNGYVADNAGLVTLNMPAVAAFGATFDIVGKGAGGWLLQMNAGQTIHLGDIASSVAGTIASTNQWDCISILCVTANTTFTVVNSVGQLSVN